MHRPVGMLLALAATASLFSISAFATVRTSDPHQLIQSVSAEVAEIAKTRSGADRQEAMKVVLRRDFDLAYVASSALGPHWNAASEDQKARLLTAFESSEARAYSDRLGKFASVTISSVTPKSSGVWLVDSQLNLASGNAMNVQWEVRQSNQELRISDVKVSGVSLFLTQQAAFKSYIQSHGGTVEPLVQVLEARASK